MKRKIGEREFCSCIPHIPHRCHRHFRDQSGRKR